MKVIYTRVSKDTDGSSTSPRAQYDECMALAERNSWTSPEHVSDVDQSAWNRRTVRPGYRRTLAGIADGSIDGLVVHHLDRLLRQSRELEELIDAIEAQTRGRFAIYSVHGDLDLSTPDGRFQARILTSVAQKESDDKSRRLKLKMAHNAREGAPHGGKRPYGWSEDRLHLDPVEGKLLLEAIGRILEGGSVSTEARKLGKDVSGFKRVLTNPRLAGLRAHHGKVVGVGQWEPLIPHETHQLLVKLLDRPAHQHHTTALQNPLVGMLRCGRCGREMGAKKHLQRQGRRYVCRFDGVRQGCGNGIAAVPLEDLLFGMGPWLIGRARVHHRHDPAVELELAAVEQRIDELTRDFYVEGVVGRGEFLELRTRLTERRDELQVSTRPDVVEPAELADRWDDIGPHERADLMGVVIDHVTIAPWTPGTKFDPTRVTLVLRPDPAE